MRKTFFRLLIAGLALGAVALACVESGALPPQTEAANTADEAQMKSLLETAQVELLATLLPASEASQAAAELTFPQRVSTAVAATQTAQSAGVSVDAQVQTAIAETQAASAGSVPLIQTAIAQTQIAQGLTQVALLHVQPSYLTPTPSVLLNQPVVNDALLSGGYVYRYGFLTGNKYLITLQFNNSVSPDYYAVVSGQNYTCRMVADYPNRLYCTGASVRGGSQTVQLFENNTNRLVFNTSLVLPQWTPTKIKDHCYPYTYCVTPCPDYKYNNYNDRNCWCGSYWGDCGHCQRYDDQGKCYYFDEDGNCRYCKTGKKCR